MISDRDGNRLRKTGCPVGKAFLLLFTIGESEKKKVNFYPSFLRTTKKTPLLPPSRHRRKPLAVAFGEREDSSENDL